MILNINISTRTYEVFHSIQVFFFRTGVKSLTVADSWLSSSPRRNPVIDVDTRLQRDARELDVECGLVESNT
jgi:hypothetical protein